MGRLAQTRAKTWLADGGSASARVLAGSANSTTNGLSVNYELLVELKGEKMALEFSAAFEGCWGNDRTSDVRADALDGYITQVTARKLSRGRGVGSVQLRPPSSADPADPDEDSRATNAEIKPKRC